jgi:hypothetical protein
LLGQPVTIRTRWIDPQVGDSFEAVQGVDWPEMTFEQAASILNTIEAMMLPADRRSTLGLLLQLWHATAKTGISEEDMQIKSATYVDDLRDYPGDVTRCVLTMARKRFKFFPTVAELVEECESMVVKRRWLLRTLQHRMKRLQQLAIVHSTTLRRIPGADAKGAGFWAIDQRANIKRLAKLRGISDRQALGLLLSVSQIELLNLENFVRAADGIPEPDD